MTPLPLTLFSRLPDYWQQLSPGARDGIVSGLIVALLLALAGFLWKFGGMLLKTPKQIESNPDPVPVSPQEVKVQVEVVPHAPSPTAPPELPRPFKSPDIPRPPVFGFVARRGEDGRDIVERLKEELAPEKNQLIVLWGSGGVGKTTLAGEACRALMNYFPGGIAWISADGKPEFGLSTLLDEIATHLRRPELRQLAPQPKDQSVHDSLVDSPTPLIVLDNFETISPSEQNACAAWLAKRASCPALITSRDVAPHARAIHILAMSPDEASEFLKKLIDQARKPEAFAELAQGQLITAADRIPLVMEWLVRQIDAAKEPKTVLEDLTHGKGDAAGRVFDRSFELAQTGDDGRATLLALSLFVPSASREALAEVSGFGDDLHRLEKALQQLDELWLIETTQQNQRVSVQGLTRQLAKARLKEHQDSDNIRQRFVSYFLAYSQENATPTAEDYDNLENDRDNLLAAMDAAYDLKDWQSVTRLAYVIALPVSGVLSVYGYWEEALRRNEQALQAARKASSEQDVGNFAHNQAVMHENRGELAEARRLYYESLEIKKKLGNQSGIAVTLHQLAMMAQEQGEWQEARKLYNESLEIAKKLGRQSGIASTLHELGRLSQNQGELEEARRLYNESLEIARKLGDQSGIAITLHQLAMMAQEQGELEEAQRLYNESLEIKKKLGNQSGIAVALHQLAMMAQEQGELEEARRLYSESLEIKRKLGNQSGIAITLHELGRLSQNQGELEEARRLYNESLEIKKKLGNQSGIANTLHQLAMIAREQGGLEEARRLYNESLEIKKKLGNQSGIAITLHQLGRLLEDEGILDGAARFYREALVIFEKLGSPNAEVARQSLARVEGKSS